MEYAAVAVAILSIEESGKVSILRHFAFGANNIDFAQLWKDYRSHRSKNVAWILPQLVAAGARDLDSLRPATNTKAEHTALLDQLKQISLYTDCLGKGNWSEPAQVIEDKLASHLVDVANLFAKHSPITVKEIELWQEHMAPLYGAPLKEMKTGLLDWFAAMKQSGLWTDGSLSAEEFVQGQSSSPT